LHSRTLALPPVPDDPVRWRPALYVGQDHAGDFEKQLLLLLDLPTLVKQHRHVVEVTQLRLTRHSLQPVELQRQRVVLKRAVEDVLRTSLQAASRDGNVPGDLISWVAGDDGVDGLEPDLGPQPSEHGLVVALHALLAGELQVALGFAAQVALQHVSGDLCGHDPASGNGSALPLATLHEWGRVKESQGHRSRLRPASTRGP